MAQENVWIGGGPGNWSDGSKWSTQAPPAAYTYSAINDGSVVALDVATPSLLNIALGAGVTESGYLRVDSAIAELHAHDLAVGQLGAGGLELNAGMIDVNSASFGVGGNDSNGNLTVNGGVFHADHAITVGAYGGGDFVLNGGDVDCDHIHIGLFPGSRGALTQLGGTLTTSELWLGEEGEEACVIWGGSAWIYQSLVGVSPGGTIGRLVIGGNAAFKGSEIRVGIEGAGVVIQTGGTVDVDRVSLTTTASEASSGMYLLLGGTLTTTSVSVGTGLIREFRMSGGTLICSAFGDPSVPLAPTGGLIRLPGAFPSQMYVFGDFDLGEDASLEIRLHSRRSYDRLVVRGSVTLAGSLLPVVLEAPAGGDVYVLIDNQGTEPVVGTFAGLPEGSAIPLSEGPDALRCTLSYVGGDGNDVVLEVSCPVDYNGDGALDGADVSGFVMLFLDGDSAADLQADGYLDIADIERFITLFLAGC